VVAGLLAKGLQSLLRFALASLSLPSYFLFSFSLGCRTAIAFVMGIADRCLAAKVLVFLLPYVHLSTRRVTSRPRIAHYPLLRLVLFFFMQHNRRSNMNPFAFLLAECCLVVKAFFSRLPYVLRSFIDSSRHLPHSNRPRSPLTSCSLSLFATEPLQHESIRYWRNRTSLGR
jgi:hypothetical protein